MKLHAVATAMAALAVAVLAILGAAPAYADDVTDPAVEVGSAVEVGPASDALTDDLVDMITNDSTSPDTLQPPPD